MLLVNCGIPEELVILHEVVFLCRKIIVVPCNALDPHYFRCLSVQSPLCIHALILIILLVSRATLTVFFIGLLTLVSRANKAVFLLGLFPKYVTQIWLLSY